MIKKTTKDLLPPALHLGLYFHQDCKICKEQWCYTGGSHLSQIFWEHENLSCLSVIQLIYIKLPQEKGKKIGKKIWAKQESGLTAVWLKWDLPVLGFDDPYTSLNALENILEFLQSA